MSHFNHPSQAGLGLNMDDLLHHVRSLQKRADAHEIRMAPLLNETFAVQSAAQQSAQQTVLQVTQLEQRGEQSGQLMTYIPYVLGGLGALAALVLVIRARRKR